MPARPLQLLPCSVPLLSRGARAGDQPLERRRLAAEVAAHRGLLRLQLQQERTERSRLLRAAGAARSQLRVERLQVRQRRQAAP